MDGLILVSLLVQTFGAFAFGSILVHTWVHRRSEVLGPEPVCGRETLIVNHAILAVSFVWFLALLATTLARAADLSNERIWPLLYLRLFLTYLYPPLIMHDIFVDMQRPDRRLQGWGWRAVLVPHYVLSLAICAFTFLAFADAIDVSRPTLMLVINVSIGTLFGLTGVYGALVTSAARARRETLRERSSRRTFSVLFALMLALSALILLAGLTDASLSAVLELFGGSLPLMFIFAATYHESRFHFFDLLVKRGAYLVGAIVLLTLYFATVAPWLDRLDLGAVRPWAHALALLPLVLASPWLFKKLGEWLDDVWLGRRFTAVEAIQRFLCDLEHATSLEELTTRAERGLGAIFDAPARVEVDESPRGRADDGPALEVPLKLGGKPVGRFVLGRRANEMPYFSQDIALAESLAEVFTSMLENVRLQRKRREQEQSARELELAASRSELRALRAQINPHFLFNALNAIAGLIHQDPARADRTVEKLADVFRYTLRGSQCEWGRLDEELEFVRSYLDVEQARFGRRLGFGMQVDPEVERLRVPTMILQTLVENAVKHGIATRTGEGRIDIAARRRGDELVLSVSDNGPGPGLGPRRARTGGAGYGLENVRRRLAGHFGERAELRLERDAGAERTVASVTMPLDRLDVEEDSPGEVAVR